MGQKVTAKSDLFSCGTLLYQLLTGDRPCTGDEYSVKQKILKLEPVRPSEPNPLLIPPWDAVVSRAMAKKPDARYAIFRDDWFDPYFDSAAGWPGRPPAPSA